MQRKDKRDGTDYVVLVAMVIFMVACIVHIILNFIN